VDVYGAMKNRRNRNETTPSNPSNAPLKLCKQARIHKLPQLDRGELATV
jgi:hypothetical protein